MISAVVPWIRRKANSDTLAIASPFMASANGCNARFTGGYPAGTHAQPMRLAIVAEIHVEESRTEGS